MSNLSIYRSRLADMPGMSADAHLVFARETTPNDVAAGRAAAAGDYLVLKDQHGVVQWWTRAAFDRMYELVDDADKFPPDTSSDLAAELLRDMPASVDDRGDVAPPAPLSPIVAHFMASADVEQAARDGDLAGVVAALDRMDGNVAALVEQLTNARSLQDRTRGDVSELVSVVAELRDRMAAAEQRADQLDRTAAERAGQHGRALDVHDTRLRDVEQLAGALDAAVRNLDHRTESLA